MGRETLTKAKVTFDMKQLRIRVYKETLRHMGNPSYIQLLVHPEDGAFAIRCVTKSEKPNFRVNWKYLTGNSSKSYEINSSFFIWKLVEQLGLDWSPSFIYRMQGDIYPEKGLAVFHPSSAEQVSSDGEYDGE